MSRIRLAERRGSLRAPNSVVQDQALQYLMLVEEADRIRRDAEEQVAEVRRLLASGTALDRVQTYYPDLFRDPSDPEAMLDDNTVEWEAPEDPDEEDLISAWIEGRHAGVIRASAFDDSD